LNPKEPSSRRQRPKSFGRSVEKGKGRTTMMMPKERDAREAMTAKAAEAEIGSDFVVLRGVGEKKRPSELEAWIGEVAEMMIEVRIAAESDEGTAVQIDVGTEVEIAAMVGMLGVAGAFDDLRHATEIAAPVR